MAGFWSRGTFYEFVGTGEIDRELADSYLAGLERQANSGDIEAIRELGRKLKETWSDAKSNIERALFHNWHGIQERDPESAIDFLTYAMRLLTIECNSSLTKRFRDAIKRYIFQFPDDFQIEQINLAKDFLRVLLILEPSEINSSEESNWDALKNILMRSSFSESIGYSELFLWFAVAKDQSLAEAQRDIIELTKQTYGGEASQIESALHFMRKQWVKRIQKVAVYLKKEEHFLNLDAWDEDENVSIQDPVTRDVFLEVLEELNLSEWDLNSDLMTRDNAMSLLLQKMDYRTNIFDDEDLIGELCDSAALEYKGLRKKGDRDGYVPELGRNFFNARADFLESQKVSRFSEFIAKQPGEWLPPLEYVSVGDIIANMCNAVVCGSNLDRVSDGLYYQVYRNYRRS